MTRAKPLAEHKRAARLGPRDTLSLALFALAAASLVLSFLVPRLDDGRSRWTDEQAEQFAAASRQLHSLSVAPATPNNEAELQQAQVDYAALQQQLELAQQHAPRLAFALRAGAAGLVLLALLVKPRG